MCRFPLAVLLLLVSAPRLAGGEHLVPGVTPPDPQVASLLVRLDDRERETRAVEADLTIEAQAFAVPVVLKGHAQSLADGTHFLLDLTCTLLGREFPVRIVADGRDLWLELLLPLKAGARKEVLRRSLAGAERSGTGLNPFQDAREVILGLDLGPLSEEKLDGAPMYVLAGALKPSYRQCWQQSGLGQGDLLGRARGGDMARGRVWVGQKDALIYRYEILGEKDHRVLAVAFTNLKVNGALDEKMFTYVPSPDAVVRDLDVPEIPHP